MRYRAPELRSGTTWPVSRTQEKAERLQLAIAGKTESEKNLWPPGETVPQLFLQGHPEERSYRPELDAAFGDPAGQCGLPSGICSEP